MYSCERPAAISLDTCMVQWWRSLFFLSFLQAFATKGCGISDFSDRVPFAVGLRRVCHLMVALALTVRLPIIANRYTIFLVYSPRVKGRNWNPVSVVLVDFFYSNWEALFCCILRRRNLFSLTIQSCLLLIFREGAQK